MRDRDTVTVLESSNGTFSPTVPRMAPAIVCPFGGKVLPAHARSPGEKGFGIAQHQYV
jgi:hypothetical protein